MEFVHDRVLYELLSDPNNNKEVDPILYVCQFYARLRQDVDIATEEKLISLKSTDKENIEKLEKHRDTILSLIGKYKQKTLRKCRENFDKFQMSLNHFAQSVLSSKESGCQVEEKTKEKENYEDMGKLYLSLKQEIFGKDLFYIVCRVCAKECEARGILCSKCQQFPGALISVRQSCLDDLQIATLNENSTASNQHSPQSVDNYLMQIWTLYQSIRCRETLQNIETFSDKFQEDPFEIYLENSINIKKDSFQNIITPTLEIISTSIESIENDTFENLNELKVLKLQGNNMKYLQSDLFKGLSNLELLNLRCNKLDELGPNCFNGMPKLKELDLNLNHLTRIKRSNFAKLTSLTKLDLSYNYIGRMQSFNFADLVKLTELNLIRNDMFHVSVQTFKGLVNLKKLDLSKNRISVLQSFAFEDLKKLECLNLIENRLSRIKANHFYGLKNLNELYLQFNSIRSVERGAFKHFKDIKTIILTGPSEDPLINN